MRYLSILLFLFSSAQAQYHPSTSVRLARIDSTMMVSGSDTSWVYPDSLGRLVFKDITGQYLISDFGSTTFGSDSVARTRTQPQKTFYVSPTYSTLSSPYYSSIESALAATDTNGTIIKVEAGVYDIDGTAGYHPLYMRPNTTIIGVPGQTIIRRVSSETDLAPLIRVYPQLDTVVSQNKRNYTIYGIIFVGSNNGIYSGRAPGGGSTAEAGISLTPAKGYLNNVRIENCEVRYTQREAIQVWDTREAKILNNKSIGINFHGYNPSRIDHLVMTGNTADSCYFGVEYDGTVTHAGTDSIGNALISNNIFTNLLGYGALLTGDNVEFSNNQISSASSFATGYLESYGILIKCDSTSYSRRFGDIRIEHNIINGFDANGIQMRSFASSDIAVTGELKINDNTIKKSGIQAIQIVPYVASKLKKLTISNNTISNWSRVSTATTADASGIIVTKVDSALIFGNRVWNDLSGSQPRDPVYVSTSVGTVVRGNDFKGRYSPLYINTVSSDVLAYGNEGIYGLKTSGGTITYQAGAPSIVESMRANNLYATNIVDKAKLRGATLLTNGGFDSGSNWTLSGAAWSITGGVLRKSGTTFYHYAEQDITTLSATEFYELTFTVSNCATVAGFNILDNHGDPPNQYTWVSYRTYANGTYTFQITGSPFSSLEFWTQTDSVSFDIDNVSLTHIGVGVTGDVVTWDGTNWVNSTPTKGHVISDPSNTPIAARDSLQFTGDGIGSVSNVGGRTVVSIPGATGYIPDSRTITINGTADQITSSAGAQDLSANRTWTLSLPSNMILPGTGGTTLPIGTTAQRPSVSAGIARYNSTLGWFDFYEGSNIVNYLPRSQVRDSIARVISDSLKLLADTTGLGTIIAAGCKPMTYISHGTTNDTLKVRSSCTDTTGLGTSLAGKMDKATIRTIFEKSIPDTMYSTDTLQLWTIQASTTVDTIQYDTQLGRLITARIEMVDSMAQTAGVTLIDSTTTNTSRNKQYGGLINSTTLTATKILRLVWTTLTTPITKGHTFGVTFKGQW